MTALALIGSVAVHASVLAGVLPPAAPIEAVRVPALSPEVDVDLSTPPPAPSSPDAVTPVRSEPGRPTSPSPHLAASRSLAPPPRDRAQQPPGAPDPDIAAPAESSPPSQSGVPQAPLHFVMKVVPPTPAPGGNAEGVSEAQGEGVYSEDGVDARPHLLAWQAPRYPDAAASAGVEVDVPVDVVIDTAGNVTEVRLPKHFGYGLDEAATAAARSYRFSRGLKAGRPVRVRMRCIVMFRLN